MKMFLMLSFPDRFQHSIHSACVEKDWDIVRQIGSDIASFINPNNKTMFRKLLEREKSDLQFKGLFILYKKNLYARGTTSNHVNIPGIYGICIWSN